MPTRGKSWGDGTYSVSFTPAFVGTYEIMVKVDQHPLVAPMKFSVAPAAADVAQTKIEGLSSSGIPSLSRVTFFLLHKRLLC